MDCIDFCEIFFRGLLRTGSPSLHLFKETPKIAELVRVSAQDYDDDLCFTDQIRLRAAGSEPCQASKSWP
jgi:hypothetical protein